MSLPTASCSAVPALCGRSFPILHTALSRMRTLACQSLTSAMRIIATIVSLMSQSIAGSLHPSEI